MKTKNLVILIAGLSGFVMTAASYAAPIDLSTWSEDGYFNGGTWVVSPDGFTATQTGNNAPTFFLGPDSYLNTRFQGTMQVSTALDDDYLGLVFGFSSNGPASYDYVLFDWKKSPQAGLAEGLRLAQATNESAVQLFPALGPNTVSLAEDFGPGTGWIAGVIYEYDVLYTANRITLDIGGTTIFDVFGSFEAGQFGFFNHSQDRTMYQVTSITSVESVPEPSTLALLGIGLASVGLARRRKKI